MTVNLNISEFYSKSNTIKLKLELFGILEQLLKRKQQMTSAIFKTQQLDIKNMRKHGASASTVRRKCKTTNCMNYLNTMPIRMDSNFAPDLTPRTSDFREPTSPSSHKCHTNSRFRDSLLSASNNSRFFSGFSHLFLEPGQRSWTSWNSCPFQRRWYASGHKKKTSIPHSSSSSWTWYFCVFLLVSLLVNSFLINSVEGCGPGRGVGRRRAPRKLTPLVYKQHVPNIPEHHSPASGSYEGPIRPNDQKRFKELVPNYNTDIIFRDDEGTGADRLMNLRCKDKLNTLAISVMNQWPGVKLRVIEGWDNTTGPQTMGSSLHYEGRAVDITTSDRDRSKYGMLARLAVEAGFDWVYYESRAYIHCSVKSDSSQGGRTGGCFSGNSTVQTRQRGVQLISEVVPGDELLSLDSDGQLTYSPVLLFLDRNQSEVREFLLITTESGRQLTITPSHLLYSFPDQVQPNYYETYLLRQHLESHTEFQQQLLSMASVTFAKNVEIGDWLLLVDSENITAGIRWTNTQDHSVRTLKLERVVSIQVREEIGVYAPLTAAGTLVVDNVVSSCYAVVQSQSLAHWSFLPIRFLHNFSTGLSQLWRQFRLLVTLSSSQTGHQGESVFVDMVRTRIKSHDGQVRSLNAHDQGIHWYASLLYSLTSRLLPSNYLYGS